MSKTYLDKRNPDGPYVFISYSHKDGEEVSKILSALSDIGADFWYDIKLRGGHDWTEKVREVTADKSCVGILYFLSENFIYSDACAEEFGMLDELKKSHAGFDAYYILLGDTQYKDWNAFISNAIGKLTALYPQEPLKVLQRATEIDKKFDKNIIYRSFARGAVDSEENVNLLFKEVFSAWGCASEQTGKMDMLIEDGLVDRDYRLKTQSSVNVGKKCEETEWKAFSYSGDTISAILVSDELLAATSLSFVESTLDGLDESINNPVKSGDGKYLEFESGFLQCIKEHDGKKLRFLRAAEHETNYLQLKEALEKVPLNDLVDDGYFFVQGSEKVLFADRGSPDVYRHIHVDAYASIIPVIDIDYKKYKEYILNGRKF